MVFIFILALLPWLDRAPLRSARYRPVKRVLTWAFFINFILLGYVGMNAPDAVSFLGIKIKHLGMVLTFFYFMYFITMPFVSSKEPARSPWEDFKRGSRLRPFFLFILLLDRDSLL